MNTKLFEALAKGESPSPADLIGMMSADKNAENLLPLIMAMQNSAPRGGKNAASAEETAGEPDVNLTLKRLNEN